MVDPQVHQTSQQPVEIMDGRQRRRVDNKRRLFQSFLALINEGVVSPTAQDLARRAKVGLRSVFRHYPEMEGLYQEMALHVQEVVRNAFARESDTANWQERVSDLARRRSLIYDSIAPYQVAIEAHRHESLHLNRHQKELAHMEHQAVLRDLGDVIGNDTHVAEALNLMLSFNTWQRLRREQGLSHSDALAVMVGTCQALLGGVAALNSHLNPPRH